MWYAASTLSTAVNFDRPPARYPVAAVEIFRP